MSEQGDGVTTTGTTTQALARAAGIPTKRGPGLGVPKFFELGALAQACVPGFYAWMVSVAPSAWTRGSPWIAKVAAVAGLGLLFGSAWLERRAPRRARLVAVWGLVATSAFVWIVAPAGLGPTHLDAGRGISGMIGWALFAYAAAAPPIRRVEGLDVRDDPPLRPRSQVPRGDVAIVAGGVVLALLLQGLGWHVAGAERALLLRLVCVTGGLGVLGGATAIALARHTPRVRAPAKKRARIVILWLGTICLVAVAGIVYALVR